MTDTSVTTTERRFSCADISKPTYKPPAKPDDGRSKPLKVTGKLRDAITNMVWRGLKRDQAAIDAGLTPNALYAALRKQHVKAHYLSELEVLRSSERARNIHRLVDIRDAGDNMPAVQAIKLLEQLDESTNSRAGSGTSQVPGFTIVLVSQGNITGSLTAPERDVTPKPLITQGTDILTESVDR